MRNSKQILHSDQARCEENSITRSTVLLVLANMTQVLMHDLFAIGNLRSANVLHLSEPLIHVVSDVKFGCYISAFMLLFLPTVANKPGP